ncbi:MAG: cysteine desulfurase [Ichthyobacteriaceae bacterium]|nr:cysteine desulfurase [Ichthyobacteriaceae bacterium]
MIYFDNASTTKVSLEVIDAMMESYKNVYGNPSSTHSYGRKAKVEVESARNLIAKTFNCKPKNIIFTSGGTESNNSIIFNAVNNLGVERIISTKIEHHSVLEVLDFVSEKFKVEVVYLDLDKNGEFSFIQLEELLVDDKSTLVSLMHVNNEIGNVIDLRKIANLCTKNNVYFHSDTIQGIGSFRYDLSVLPIDFITISAHKFGGPKGVGAFYKSDKVKFAKQMLGGEQERNFRAGTENIQGIVGLKKALELSYVNFEKNHEHIVYLKKYLVERLSNEFPNIKYNGLSGDLNNSVSKIINIQLPIKKNIRMLVFQFDLKGISISEGSACSAGNSKGSHVLQNINVEKHTSNIRVSFSVDNSIEEVDSFVNVIKSIV